MPAPPDAPDDPSLPCRFGQKVRDTRRERALTQCELAERLGITQATLSRIEHGALVPDLALCARIATALGKSLLILFE